MKYFVCNKCGALKEIQDDHFSEENTFTIDDKEIIVNTIKPEYITETVCVEHGRKMRELTKEEYDLLVSP